MRAFFTYLGLVARSVWGIAAIISLAVWLVSLFVERLDVPGGFGFAVVLVALLGGGFTVYARQQRRLQEQIGALEKKVIELQTPAFSAERLAAAEDQWKGLSEVEKEAMKHLLIHGELTEKQAVRHLQDKGIAIGMVNVFHGIEARTGLVQRTAGVTRADSTHGYTGTYQVNPKMLEPLMAIVESELDSTTSPKKE